MEELEAAIRRAATGDPHAFGTIVRRFQDMAVGYAFSILGDFHLAEDAAQEAFVQAYRDLSQLREHAAFPSWFRRIVFKHCDRMTRRKRIQTVPLDAAVGTAANEAGPAQIAEQREMQEKVLEAIRALPEHQRVVTTLFYINGYSQNDIADFLEVPVTTVKKRLHDSRKRLKERMMDMVGETLKEHVPDERFSQKVISKLLERPRPLEIEGHPIREIVQAIRSVLSDYESVEGEEMVEKSFFLEAGGNPDMVYHVDESRVLRSETAFTTLQAMAGRTPPVRLMTAGRAFRPDREDSAHLKVFHQLDVLCIQADVDPEAMKAMLRKALEAALGAVELKWEEANFTNFEHCLEAAVKEGHHWTGVAGCGMLSAKMLEEGGYNPRLVSGFAFGLGLERLAMIKHGLDDIRKLWQPPYIVVE